MTNRGVSAGHPTTLDLVECTIGDLVGELQAREAATRPARRSGPGRPPILPVMALWSGMLVCVSRGFSSQLELWRLLRRGGIWGQPPYPVSDQAVYTRLGRLGSEPLATLFARVTALLLERLAAAVSGPARPLAPGIEEVVAIDETTLDQVARSLPELRPVPAGDRRLLPGKVAGVYDVRRRLWRRVVIHPEVRNEKHGARALLDGLAPGTLILADLGYFSFAWFDTLHERGYWWVSRQRAKTSTRVVHAYYNDGSTFDGIVWLGAYRADRAAHAVRLVRFQHGGTTYQYITNVLDPATLSIEDIARLYARRWDIETAFKLVKRELGLHLLWSAKLPVIIHQIWAVLVIAQILQALRVEAAGRAGVSVDDVSMTLLVRYLPRYAAEGIDPLATFIAEGRALGFIRPSRRIRSRAPTVPPDAIIPAPSGLLLVRTPRHANKINPPRSTPARTN